MKTRISKAYRGKEHIGWKKTVGGREWFLGYGTAPAAEAKAIAFAEVLEAKWRLARAGGATELSQTDVEEAKALITAAPRWTSARQDGGHTLTPAPEPTRAPQPTVGAVIPVTIQESAAVQGPRRWLFASIDEFVATTKRSLKPDGSNGDHVFNTCERITRARDAVEDMPLDALRRKELDDWLLAIRGMPSKLTGKPLGAVTVRNIVSGVRAALTKFAEWEWWTPPPLWEKAFNGYSIKKLQTPAERKYRKRRPPAHSVDEKRVLWNLALPFDRAMMAMADWAGHTQMEVATLTFDEIKEEEGEMYIDRDRHKTGIHGRWWIPPEAAAVIRRVVSKTPRDRRVNPYGLAFLTPAGMPLVHRSDTARRAKSDYVGKRWAGLLRAARPYGVRHISYKFMRKGMAQLIRDDRGKEVSRTFLCHADEDVQDENYTRTSVEKVEHAVRALYPDLRSMFEPVKAADWPDLRVRIARQNGIALEDDLDAAA